MNYKIEQSVDNLYIYRYTEKFLNMEKVLYCIILIPEAEIHPDLRSLN